MNDLPTHLDRHDRELTGLFGVPWLVLGLVGGGLLVLIVAVALLIHFAETEQPNKEKPSSAKISESQPVVSQDKARVFPDSKKGSFQDKTRPAAGVSPATESQRSYLAALIKRQDWSDRERDLQVEKVLGYARPFSELSKSEASRLIDAFKDRKK